MTQAAHDVAISAVSYDCRLVAELTEKLSTRIARESFWHSQADDLPMDAAADAVAADVIANSARVVIVLHQRLWGRDGHSVAEALGVRERMKAKRHKTVHVLQLDNTPVPTWLKPARCCVLGDVGLDIVSAAIASTVAANGGLVAAAPRQDDAVEARVRPTWSDGPPPYMAQPRAQSALKREFDTMITELTERVRSESDRLGDKELAIHCAPERLVVQLGAVGLSMSWMPARTGNLEDGRLLVIEWDGAVAHGRAMGGGRTASPTHEQVFRPVAHGPDDWCWRPEGGNGSSYSSRSLAGQCFTNANNGRIS